jgi:hypothetical protein
VAGKHTYVLRHLVIDPFVLCHNLQWGGTTVEPSHLKLCAFPLVPTPSCLILGISTSYPTHILVASHNNSTPPGQARITECMPLRMTMQVHRTTRMMTHTAYLPSADIQLRGLCKVASSACNLNTHGYVQSNKIFVCLISFAARLIPIKPSIIST